MPQLDTQTVVIGLLVALIILVGWMLLSGGGRGHHRGMRMKNALTGATASPATSTDPNAVNVQVATTTTGQSVAVASTPVDSTAAVTAPPATAVAATPAAAATAAVSEYMRNKSGFPSGRAF
jgi:hypothetical protein